MFYGFSVAARMGLKTAAFTRLAREDFKVVEERKWRSWECGYLPKPHPSPPTFAWNIPPPIRMTGSSTSMVKCAPFTPQEMENAEPRTIIIGTPCEGESVCSY